MKRFIYAVVPLLFFLSGCASMVQYKPVPNLSKLEISFSDHRWDGKTVPKEFICGKYAGSGASPALRVNQIPAGTNALIVLFRDLDYAPLSYEGGHGGIRIPVSNQKSIDIPSVPGDTNSLPEGIFMEQMHGEPRYFKAGAYLAPCSGGRGHRYACVVKAVFEASSKNEESKLLGQGEIELGIY
jgi:phosphatidylethanolamine-binding protein (PEBP) family uncharacterized protein